MDQRYLTVKQICSKIFTNNVLEERDRIQLHKEIIRCPLLVRLTVDKIEGIISQDQTQIACIKNIEAALLILLNTSTSLEHYAESLVALMEAIDKLSTNHRQLHLTCATLQPSIIVQTRAMLAVILLTDRADQFKASWIDLLIIELRSKIPNSSEEHLTLMARDWHWAATQISWENTPNSTKTLFEQTTQLLDKRYPVVPKSIREASVEEFKVPLSGIHGAIEKFCSTSDDQWLFLQIDIDAFFKAPSSFLQCIPAKNLFDAYSPVETRAKDTDIQKMLKKIAQVPNDSKHIELSGLLSTVYRLVVDGRLDKHRCCAFLATVVGQLNYASQLGFFAAMLAICCQYRKLEISSDTTSDSVQSIDVPMNSSTTFAFTAWTLILYCQRLPKTAQLSDVLEIIAQLYEFDSAGLPHDCSVIAWSNASLCDLMTVSLLRNTSMTAQLESLVDRGKIWMNKFKALKPVLKVSLLKLLFQSIVQGVSARVSLHRWFFEFQRQVLRAFVKDDSVVVSRAVVSAIAALLGEVTSKTNGVLSPMCYNDNKLDLLLKFLLIYDDTCQHSESEQTPVAMILESMLKDPNSLLIGHGLNLLSLLMFKNFLSIHKIKLESANVVFNALESSPDNLIDCLLRRLPHEPKTVVLAYEKAIGRAMRSEKLKTNKLLKPTSEKIKKTLTDSALDISILTSHNGYVNAFSFNALEMFRSSPIDLKRAIATIQSTEDGLVATGQLVDHLIGTVRKIQLTREQSNLNISRKDLARLLSSLVAWKLAKWQELQLSLLPLPEELSNHVLQVLHTNTMLMAPSTVLVLPAQPAALGSLFQSSLDWQDNIGPDEISFFGNQALPRPPPVWAPWLLSPSLPSKNVKPLTTLRLEGIIKSYLDFVAGLPNLDLLTRFFVVSALGSTDRLFTQALIDTAVNIEAWLLDHVIVEECQAVLARLTHANHPTTNEFYAPIYNLVQFLLKWPRSLWHNIFDPSFNRSISADQSSGGLLHLLEFAEQHKADLGGCTDLCARLQYCLSRPSIDAHVPLNQRWSALFKRVWKINYTILDPSTVEFGLLEWLDWELIAFTDPSWHLSQVSTTDLDAYHKRMIDTLTSRPVQHRRNKLSVDMEHALKHALLALLKHCINCYQRRQYWECPKFVTPLFDKLCQIANNPNNTAVNHYPVTVWLFHQLNRIESLAPVVSFIDKILPHILIVPFTQTELELKSWLEAWTALYTRVQSHQTFARVLLISTARGWCLRYSLLGSSKGDKTKAKQAHLDEILPAIIRVMSASVRAAIIAQLSKDFSALRDSKRASAIDKSFKYFENKCSEIEPNDDMEFDQPDFGEARNPFDLISHSPAQNDRPLAQSSVDLPVSNLPSLSQNNTNAMPRMNRSLDLPIEQSSPIKPRHVSPAPTVEHIQIALPKEDSAASIPMDIDIELSLPKELSEVNLDVSENDLFEDMALTESAKAKPSQAKKSPKTPASKSKKTPTKPKSSGNHNESVEKKSEEKKEDSVSEEILLKKNTKSKTPPKSKAPKKEPESQNDKNAQKSPVKSPAQKSKAKSPTPKTNAKKSPANKKKTAKKGKRNDTASDSDKDENKKAESESNREKESEKDKSASENSARSKSKKNSSSSSESEASAKRSSEEQSKSSVSRKSNNKSSASDSEDESSKASVKSSSSKSSKASSKSKSSAKSSSSKSSKSSKSSSKSSSSSKSKSSAKSSSSKSSKSSKSSSKSKSSSSSAKKSTSTSAKKSESGQKSGDSDKEKSEKSESSSAEKEVAKKSKRKSAPKKKAQRPRAVPKKQTKADNNEEKSAEDKNEMPNNKAKAKQSAKNAANKTGKEKIGPNAKKPIKDEVPVAKKNKSSPKQEAVAPNNALFDESDTRHSVDLSPPLIESNSVPIAPSQARTSAIDLPLSQDTIDLTATDVNGSVDGDCVVLSSQGPIDNDFQPAGSKRKRSEAQNMKPNKRTKAAMGKVNSVQEITD